MKTKRIHGKSRLEVALEKSIANELKIRSLRKDLCALSLEFAQFRKATVPLVSEAWRADVFEGRDHERCYP
jgi:hypothetical protein